MFSMHIQLLDFSMQGVCQAVDLVGVACNAVQSSAGGVGCNDPQHPRTSTFIFCHGANHQPLDW